MNDDDDNNDNEGEREERKIIHVCVLCVCAAMKRKIVNLFLSRPYMDILRLSLFAVILLSHPTHYDNGDAFSV